MISTMPEAFLPVPRDEVHRLVETLQETADDTREHLVNFSARFGYNFRYRGDRRTVAFHCPTIGHYFHIGLSGKDTSLLYYAPHTTINCVLFNEDGGFSKPPSDMDIIIDRLLESDNFVHVHDRYSHNIVDGVLLIFYHYLGRWNIASPRTPDIQHSYNFTSTPVYKTFIRVLTQQHPDTAKAMGVREEHGAVSFDNVPTDRVFSIKLKSMDALPYTDLAYNPLEYCVMGVEYSRSTGEDSGGGDFAKEYAVPTEYELNRTDLVNFGSVEQVMEHAHPDRKAAFVSKGKSFETMARILLAPTNTDSISRRFAKVYERLQYEMYHNKDDPIVSCIAAGLAGLDSPHKVLV